MTKKPTVTTLQSGFNSTETLNANFEALRDGFDNTLSLDGSTPNAMEADLDLNGNNIIGATGLLINGTDYLADVTAAKAAALVAQAGAETAETNAETAESNAEASETAAATSATNASTSASNASASASAAASSAVDATNNGAAQVALAAAQVALAETAKTSAETAETNAETAQTAAELAESNAATSETNAATSETNAATSATNAATSATEAETAKTGAETARDSALAALDSFDDRYLGVKTSDPTVDNDGDALVVGSLYFNSTTNLLYVYNGTTWQVTANAASGDLVSTNNLSDLTSPATARTNLGLGTGDSPTFAGLTTTADVTFGDNDKAIFGAGNDLQIYHSGTNSFIDDAGTGNLQIRASSQIKLQKYTGENMFVGIADGTASMYYDNSQKIATTSTGVDVIGSVTATDLILDGGTSSSVFLQDSTATNGYQLRANVSSSVDGGLLVEDLSGANIARFDSGGDISFYEDTGSSPKFFWDASAESLGIGTSSPQAKLHLNGTGATDAKIELQSGVGVASLDGRYGNIIFSADEDNVVAGSLMAFKVDNSEAMRIDSSGKVGIGTDSPSALLHMTGASAQLRIEASSGNSQINFADTADANVGILAYDHSANAMTFRVNDSERMRIDSSGNVGIGTDSPTADLDVSSSGDTLVRVKSTGTGDADATLVLDSADTGESVLQFEHDGVYGAKVEWFTDGEPDLNIATVGATSVIDMQPNGVRTGRFDTSGLEVTGTVTATSFAGDGSALTGVGGSTTAGAVGTYAYLINTVGNIGITPGATTAGSSLRYSAQSSNSSTSSSGYSVGHTYSSGPSGTWRAMGGRNTTGTYTYAATLYVRIS